MTAGSSGEQQPGQWVLLSYRLPREPSTPRIALWRRLKRLGVAQLSDGLVALPADARTQEQLEWAAEEVQEAGGQAGVWLAAATTAAQEQSLAEVMKHARVAEYRALTEALHAAMGTGRMEQRRALTRLSRLWREISRRDFFSPPERDVAAAALNALRQAAAQPLSGEVEVEAR